MSDSEPPLLAPTAMVPTPMAQRLWVLLGWALVIVGIPIFLLPIPLSAILMIAGFAILARNSPAARAGVRWAFRRFPLLTRPLRRAAQRFRPPPGPCGPAAPPV